MTVPAGTTSKNLVHRISGKIGELSKERELRSHLYQLLNFYQNEWMVNYFTTPITTALTLIAGTTSYAVDGKYFKITRIFDNNEDTIGYIYPTDHKHIYGHYDAVNNKIVIDSDFNDGDVIYYSGYRKPDLTTEEISSLIDPIIGVDFHELLVMAVASHYNTKERPQVPLIEVEKRVERLALKLNRKDGFNLDILNETEF